MFLRPITPLGPQDCQLALRNHWTTNMAQMSHIPDRNKCFADTNGVPSSYGVAHRSPMGDDTLAAAQNMPDFFRYESKLEIARIAGQSDTTKCFSDTNGLQFSYDSCTPLHTLQLRACPKMPDRSGRPLTPPAAIKVRAKWMVTSPPWPAVP